MLGKTIERTTPSYHVTMTNSLRQIPYSELKQRLIQRGNYNASNIKLL